MSRPGEAGNIGGIGPTFLQISASAPHAQPRLRRAHATGGLSAAGILALQRRVGNRGTTALLQRLAPDAAPAPTAAEEAAGLAADAKGRAEARRLLPAEIEEVDALSSLVRPQGPGLVLGTGTRKLLDGVDKLGTKRAGSPSGYARDPETEGALPSFVLGSLDDPDGRISVTADGLLEVMKTKRVPVKGKKGQPAPPPKVTHDTALLDLQGKTIKLAKDTHVGELFLAQAQAAVESEAQAKVLDQLRASDTEVEGGAEDAEHRTLGEVVSEIATNDYTQRSYYGKGADKRQTELLKKVMGAFDELRAEFEAFKAPASTDPALPAPDPQTLARQFAAKLQPTLFSTAAAAQAEVDQATAAQAAADSEATAAKAELTALKAAKGIPKAEQAAHGAAIKKAQDRKSAADKALSAAKSLVKSRTRTLAGLVEERDKFATTIAWILDPATTTEARAAKSVGSLCNVLSFYLYGKAVGVVPADMDFKDYYLAEVKAGRIRYYKGSDSEGVFWGEGSAKWSKDRDLTRLDHPAGPPVAIGDPSRATDLQAFLASGANVAITHQDFDHDPPSKPHHWLLIVRGADGVWRNMDHTSTSFRRRGAITDWSRVFQIEVDAGLIAQAKSGALPAVQ